MVAVVTAAAALAAVVVETRVVAVVATARVVVAVVVIAAASVVKAQSIQPKKKPSQLTWLFSWRYKYRSYQGLQNTTQAMVQPGKLATLGVAMFFTSTICATMDTAISAGVLAPILRPTGPCRRSSSS